MARELFKFPTFQKFLGVLKDRQSAHWAFDALYGMQTADKYITSTQVLALNTTGIDIVPAPGSSKYNMFLGAIIYMKYNSAAYTASSKDLVITYTDKSGAAVSHTVACSIFNGATTDKVAYAYPLNAAASTLVSVANAVLTISTASGNWTVGDSPLRVRTFYRVVVQAELDGIVA